MSTSVDIPLEQIPEPDARARLRCAGRDIALFNIGGMLHAIDDSCPHQGSSLLAGTLNGRLIQCRAHGLRFDLATGCMPNVPGFGVRVYVIERDPAGGATLLLPAVQDSEETPR